MLVIALLKGVPARTTKVVIRTDNTLQREAMEMVLNPNDVKALEAAAFIKAKAGGKVIGVSMGPDARLKPVLQPLFGGGPSGEGGGLDEAYIISDPKLAGSDTVATSYAVSLGVLRLVERNIAPLDNLLGALRAGESPESIKGKAASLYASNLLPRGVYSDSGDGGIVGRLSRGEINGERAQKLLEAEKEKASKFVVVAGIRTSDGETGSVGPQVAESLAENLNVDFPHATYVEDLDIEPSSSRVRADRRISGFIQRLEIECPCLLTFAPEYSPRAVLAADTMSATVRAADYRGKMIEPAKLSADDLKADPARLGFNGSVVIVGPAVLVGKPPAQKTIDKTLVFVKRVEMVTLEGMEYGPFEKGEVADGLPAEVKLELVTRGDVALFSLQMLAEEVLAG